MLQRSQLFQTIFGHPSGAVHLPAMALINRIELRLAGQTNLTAVSVKTSLSAGMPALEIIRQLAEQCADNFDAMAFVLGDRLAEDVVRFNKQLTHG